MEAPIRLALCAAWKFLRKYPVAVRVEADVWHWVWPAYRRIAAHPEYDRGTAVRGGVCACIDEMRLALGRAPSGKRTLRERMTSIHADPDPNHDHDPATLHHDYAAADARLDAPLWVGRMTVKQREAVVRYFGLHGRLPLTQREVAAELGICEPAVSLRLKAAGVS